jgi:molybdenum cofactor guanylyltransferase
LLLATAAVVMVVAGDLPFVQPEFLATLGRLNGDEDAAVPRTQDGWHPLCAAYRRRIAGRIKGRLDRGALRVSDALSDMRVRDVTGEALARMDRDGMLLMNVNTPDDLRQAERHARSRS